MSKYRLIHRTIYHYNQAVRLGHHNLHLCPRNDGGQRLLQHHLRITPEPQFCADNLDAEGNATTDLYFSNSSVEQLILESESWVEMTRSNPFNYLLEPWAIALPFDYPASLLRSLQPYLHNPASGEALSGDVIDWAQAILHQQQNNASTFLTELNQTINRRSTYEVRHTGAPQPAGLTLNCNAGSCRDFAVLFIAACRAVGLAARFVSGYQAGDPDQTHRELHAWAEVYLPGGGWRGFDPTLGLAVADGHIALAASAEPRQVAPVTGSVERVFGEGSTTAGSSSRLEHQIELEILN